MRYVGSGLVALAAGLLVLFIFFAALGAFSPAETVIVSVIAAGLALLFDVHMYRVHHALGKGHGSELHRSLNTLRERRGF